MSHKKTSFSALTHKITAVEIINNIEAIAPHLKISLRWCPRHKGVEGNKRADRLATSAAKKPLPKEKTNRPTFSSFRAVVKDWAKAQTLASYSPQDITRLGHLPHPHEHFNALTKLKNKHSISTVTQLRNGHVPLFSYVFRRNLRADPTCACGTGPENVEHFLFMCPTHEDPRQELQVELEDLDVPFNRLALHYPSALEPIANFTSSTWRLRSRWDWAEIQKESTPRNKKPPD